MRIKRILFFICCLFSFMHLRAQLCQGSLGDPIVNITFGSGSNPGPPLVGAATNYSYVATDCPSDGNYTVRNRTDRCYGGWHTLFSDHTGDPNGYFMLVNASYQPSAFYVDTVDLVCSNTTYEFAAWIINMNAGSECNGNPIQPNLTFNIEKTDGTVLQTFNSGNIPPQSSPSWRQFGFFFSTPSTVNKVVLRITNNAPGGCGNDLALDDITFRPCGPLVTPYADGVSNGKDLCEGEAGQALLSGAVSTGFDNPYFQWQKSLDNGITWTDIPGANGQAYLATLPSTTVAGNYLYRLSVSKVENSLISVCRVNSTPLVLRVNKKPVVTITNNGPFCEGTTASLAAAGGKQYNWNGPNGFSASGPAIQIPAVRLSQSGQYYLAVSSNEGCVKMDSTDLVIHPKPTASISNSNVSICEGDSVQLFASGGGTYQWTPANGLSGTDMSSPFASPKDSTQYLLTVSNSFGCTDSVSSRVNVNRRPTAFAGPDKSLVEGQQVQLQAKASGSNVKYEWTPPNFLTDPKILQPFASPRVDQDYTLTVISNEGCGVAVDSVLVKVFKGIFVPNAFTPNNDGRNDRWRILGLTFYKDYEIRVFNRYGELVYKTNNADAGWNGTYKERLLPPGTYPYFIKIKDIPLTLTGLVTIIR